MFTFFTASIFSNNNETIKPIESANYECITASLSCGIDALMCDFTDNNALLEEVWSLDNDICG